MSLKNDIVNAVNSILDNDMDTKDVNNIPDINDSELTFGLTGKRFKSICFYIDMRGSTAILEKYNADVVIKIHKAYFITILKIVRTFGGEVRSFNGDSLLAFFPGDNSITIENAVISAMQVKYMLLIDNDCLKSKIKRKYKTEFDFGLGLDLGTTTAAKIGQSGSNNHDLIWIGPNVNHSVKISDGRSSAYNIGMTKRLYDNLTNKVKFDNNNDMWKKTTYQYNGNQEVEYITSYYWKVD